MWVATIGFVISGFALPVLQPVAVLAVALAGAAIAMTRNRGPAGRDRAAAAT